MCIMEKDKKLRPMKIWEILRRETDEDHPMGTETLRAKLEECGYPCVRKTVYADIALLNDNGYEIMCNRKISNEYYVEDRSFDIPELQILMDAVQAASFITDKKTKVLVGKIAQLAGDKKAEVLQKNTVEFHTPKSDNEQIFYIVDKIGNAIEERRQISFLYFDYDILHQRVYRKEKRRYTVNPLSTVFSNDNYYLMCYDDKHGNIGHYRIDRMDDVNIEYTPITETEESKRFDLSRHKRALFGMFNGEDAQVTFQADKSLVDHIFDKFGKGIHMAYGEGNTVVFTADVQVSKPFLGWCCSFGNMLKVTAPQSVADKVKEFLAEMSEQYK